MSNNRPRLLPRRCGAAILASLAALSICSVARADGEPSTRPSIVPASIELAEQLEAVAYDQVENRVVAPPVWRQTAALLEAAHRLNPAEPRYARELYNACVSGNDPDAALTALNAYLTLVPDDQVAQAHLIDTYLDRMQTAEAMLNYARSLIGKAQLPPPVRAHAAVHCAQTLLDRSERQEAIKMLNTAIQIEPLCIEALRLKLQLTRDEGVSRRCGLLLQILRANPLDADAATELAGELADVGLPEASAIWYSQAVTAYSASQRPRAPELGKGAAVELYLCGHAADAQVVIQEYMAAVPDDADAWTIDLAICRDTVTDPGQYEAMTHLAVNAATRRLQSVRDSLGCPPSSAATTSPASPSLSTDLSTPTTSPTTQPLVDAPDLSGDMPLLVKAGPGALTDAYISAADSLAWMRLYFLRDAGDATQRIIDGLARILPPDDPTLARLVGWSYLVRGQWDQAQLKLSAVADQDAYAQLGMVLIDDQSGLRANADNLAKRCMAAHPSGPQAAVLYSALHGRGARVMALPQGQIVATEVQGFPRDWLNIIAQPQLFYTVAAEPLEAEFPFPHAMLVRLTIQNVSDFDITMGDDGTLHRQLVFDAAAHGIVEKQIGQTVFEDFWQRLLLPKGQWTSQVVRLDRGPLLRLLGAQPDLPMELQFSVMINPMRVPGRTDYVIGGAGCRVPLTDLLERSARPFATAADRQKLYALLTGASPAARLDTVSAVATFGLDLRRAAGGVVINQSYNTSQELLDHARLAMNDPDPAVRAWANYINTLVAENGQDDLVLKLAKSDEWYARILALLAARRLSDHGMVAATAMSSDPDVTVRNFAQAILDDLNAVAAAQAQGAATQPAQ